MALRNALPNNSLDWWRYGVYLDVARFFSVHRSRYQSRFQRAMKRSVNHYYYIPQIVAIAIVGPLTWMAFDRTPPLILHDGVITPNPVHTGQKDVSVTWRATYAGRDCPGLTQRELVDSRRSLWPQLIRERKGVLKTDVDDRFRGTVTTPPLAIPDMAPGKACYRVTQFYYCNILQRIFDWPIVQVSPCIDFEVIK
jgi:hypothetical protein